MKRKEAVYLRSVLEQAAQSLDDATALTVVNFHPAWAEGTAYAVGFKVRYGDGLWKCRQAHTAQAGWEPGDAASLWERVCESHSGTLEDPVPYDAGMALEDGKYYHQDYVIYRCFRDTGNPVYQALAELVDLYVEIV